MPIAALACAALSSETSSKIFFEVAVRNLLSQSVKTSSTLAKSFSFARLSLLFNALASDSLISRIPKSPLETEYTNRFRTCPSKSPSKRARSLPCSANALSSVKIRVESTARIASASAKSCS